ncbi:NAD(P)-dependent oxidoreductase [Pelagibacterium xiamenense]|uniref:NAD(P)-dependent oxidoreductase n=1 Tax=Pelagibacterium xiamenense TaxID=2901140 RepID=UPI001E2DACD5|nr:NAD(P)-binding oxidoreductase [Pelagibacterium xiamenense]MCD7059062.1 SDR family oxidoreductase [Pelagibacterium xiamenense]
MKLVVLGANGRTGGLVVREALDKGAIVTAVVRSDAKRPAIRHNRLSVAVGDPCDPQFLSGVFRGQDAAISALGGRRPTKRATSIYYRSADAIIEATSQTGVRKILVTSSALLFPPRRLLDRFLMAVVRNVVQSAILMERKLSAANLDVVVARCGFLTDRNETRYRAEPGSLPVDGSSVARLGLAMFLVDTVHRSPSGFQVYGVSGPRDRGQGVESPSGR